MALITCYIPKHLSEISSYVIKLLEERIGFQAHVIQGKEEHFRFEFNGNAFTLPAYFINAERELFLKKRSRFNYLLKTYHFFGDSYIGMVPNPETPSPKEPYDIDILGTIFVLLSRYEEHILDHTCFDRLGRFKAESAINFEYLHIPIVDQLVKLFEIIMHKEFGLAPVKPQERYTVLPSHDVDRPFEYLYYTIKHLIKRMGGDIVVRKSLSKALERRTLFYQVRKGNLEADPYNTFDWIMETSEMHERTSTFHFIAEPTNPVYDQKYSLKDPEILNLLKSINQRGHKIALHPSFEASVMPGQLKKEFEILKQTCNMVGISQNEFKSRYHYLRWNNDSINELENAGVNVDQTLTFAQKAGFRCGTSKPYKAFNFSERSSSTVTIEPLIVMDQTLFSTSYMGLRNDMEEAWNIVQQLKDQCRKYQGHFTVLWHNNLLSDPEMKAFYEACIK